MAPARRGDDDDDDVCTTAGTERQLIADQPLNLLKDCMAV